MHCDQLNKARKLHHKKNFKKAISAYEDLCEDFPDNDLYKLELADSFRLDGQVEKALLYLKRINNESDFYKKALLLQGLVYIASPQKALKIFNQAEQLFPGDTETILLIVESYRLLQNFEVAEEKLKNLLEKNNPSSLVYYYCAKLYVAKNEKNKAFHYLLDSLIRDKKFTATKDLLIDLIMTEEVLPTLIFQEKYLNVINWLFSQESTCLQKLSVKFYPFLIDYLKNNQFEDCQKFQLLKNVLTYTIIYDLKLEGLLVNLRKRLSKANDRLFKLLKSSLAIHSSNNEYLWPMDDEEFALISKFKSSLSSTNDESLLTISMYSPISDLLPLSIEIDSENKLYQAYNKSPLSLTSIDQSSAITQDQYEKYPYPKWKGFHKTETTSIREWCKYHFNKLENFPESNKNILVAGCGTGQHTFSVASNLNDGKVLGIDLSINSLKYASAQAEKFHVKNLHFAQADIMNINQINRKFSIIEAVGVLHHTFNVDSALSNLLGVLEPGGLIKLGLYSKIAREPLAQYQKIDKKLPEIPDVRNFRKSLIASPDISYISQFSDFYYTSGVVDLFFNVREHSFTLADLRELIDKKGLKFLSFVLPRVPKGMETPSKFSLEGWENFENKTPSFFRGMYQFWCQLPKN